MNYDVEILPEADRDLEDILDYILLDNEDIAKDVLQRIDISLEQVEEFPFSGVRVRDSLLNHYDFRMLIVIPYIIFYRVIKSTVFIYRILHGSQDYTQILKK